MRQFVGVIGTIAIFMYTGFTLQHGTTMSAMAEVAPVKMWSADGATRSDVVASVSAPRAAAPDVANLQTALEAAGATLDNVVITGWVRTDRPQSKDRVVASLGWSSGKAPDGEVRESSLFVRNGQYVVSVRWVMAGQKNWAGRTADVRKALAKVGADPATAVQLSGAVNGAPDLVQLAGKALDALGATNRQPWSDPRAASVAGQTAMLPEGPYSVNLQVAARRDSLTGRTRVWVAWPALLQEY